MTSASFLYGRDFKTFYIAHIFKDLWVWVRQILIRTCLNTLCGDRTPPWKVSPHRVNYQDTTGSFTNRAPLCPQLAMPYMKWELLYIDSWPCIAVHPAIKSLVQMSHTELILSGNLGFASMPYIPVIMWTPWLSLPGNFIMKKDKYILKVYFTSANM